MPTYLFDLGNSNSGPVGAVIEVTAPSKRVALAHARLVAKGATDHPYILKMAEGEARFYLNPAQIQLADGWTEE